MAKACPSPLLPPANGTGLLLCELPNPAGLNDDPGAGEDEAGEYDGVCCCWKPPSALLFQSDCDCAAVIGAKAGVCCWKNELGSLDGWAGEGEPRDMACCWGCGDVDGPPPNRASRSSTAEVGLAEPLCSPPKSIRLLAALKIHRSLSDELLNVNEWALTLAPVEVLH